ncbi:hypothetical protein [Humidesulfovibrio idahonensis]
MLRLLPQPNAATQQRKLSLVSRCVAAPAPETVTTAIPAAGPAALLYTLLRHGRALPRQEAESRLRESLSDILERPLDGAAGKASGNRITESSGNTAAQRSDTLSRALLREDVAEPFGGPFQAA